MPTDEPRWLDDDEQAAWLALVAVLLALPASLDAQLQRDAGLTFYEYSVLAGLSAVGSDGLRMSELAVVTNGSLSRLSQVVTRMEQRGWVERTADPADGRATRVVLRAPGRRVLAGAAPAHVEHVRRTVFDRLSRTQVGQLRRIATNIAAAMPENDNLLAMRERVMRGAGS